MEGWVWKKSMLGLGTARRNYAILEYDTLSFYSIKPTSPVEKADHIRLKLMKDDITEIELLEDKTIVLGCRFRVYEMRSENGDVEAERWVSQLRVATGKNLTSVRPSAGTLEEHGIPWMVDGAWLDEMLPSPLTMVTKVNLKSEKDQHAAHVRLADGSTFTVEGLKVGGEGKEVASAGNKKLVAHLEQGDKNDGESKGEKSKGRSEGGTLDVINQAFAHAPAACAATMLVVRHWPDTHASDEMLYAVLAIYLVGVVTYISMKLRGKGAEQQGEVALVLRSSSVQDIDHNISKRRTSIVATRSNRTMSTLSPVQVRRKSAGSASDLREEGSQGGGTVNFSGQYSLNLKLSADPTEMLTALGVPWIARKAIASSSRKLEIDHEGNEWTETIITSVMTKTMHLNLDGTPTVEVRQSECSERLMCDEMSEENCRRMLIANPFYRRFAPRIRFVHRRFRLWTRVR